MEDSKIIDLYFDRNEDAISETSAKYGGMIKSIAYNILKNTADSHECENDTYFAAWNRIPPDIPRCLAAFLGRITRNIALDRHDYYSAAKRNRDFEVALSELGELLSKEPNPETSCEARETAELISDFLRQKSYTKRVVFIRRYWYCDSISKISSDFGFSESKVKSMLMRIRKELRKYLEQNGVFI